VEAGAQGQYGDITGAYEVLVRVSEPPWPPVVPDRRFRTAYAARPALALRDSWIHFYGEGLGGSGPEIQSATSGAR
jgi:hypothetical protein